MVSTGKLVGYDVEFSLCWECGNFDKEKLKCNAGYKRRKYNDCKKFKVVCPACGSTNVDCSGGFELGDCYCDNCSAVFDPF